jgi:y4mF family transcriptional regulator
MPDHTPGWFTWTTSAELGEAVLTAREAAGLTQAELAARARVSRKFVFELERGKGTLRIDKVSAVLRALGLTPLIVPVELLSALR